MEKKLAVVADFENFSYGICHTVLSPSWHFLFPPPFLLFILGFFFFFFEGLHISQ